MILLFVVPASWAVPCRTAVDDHSRARPALLLHGWAFAERPGLAVLVSGHALLALLALLVMFGCVFFALYLVRISQMRLAFCKSGITSIAASRHLGTTGDRKQHGEQ